MDLINVVATRALLDAIRTTHLPHLAWTVAPGGFWTTRENLEWVRATLALYRAFVASECTHVLGTGSCLGHDCSSEAVAAPLDEDAPRNSATL